MVYRGTDGDVHSLYWTGTGAVGHDNLSGVAGTPKAAGDPVAYYTAQMTCIRWSTAGSTTTCMSCGGWA